MLVSSGLAAILLLAQDSPMPKQGGDAPKGGAAKAGGKGAPGQRGQRGGPGGGAAFGPAATYVRMLAEPEVLKEIGIADGERANIALLRDELTAGDRKYFDEARANAPAPAAGQRPPRGGTPDPAQTEKLRERTRAVRKMLEDALDGKYARLNQIRLQVAGLLRSAASDSDVRKALGIDDDLAKKLADARSAAGGPGGAGGRQRGGAAPDPAARAEARKKADDSALALLSEAHKQKWETLVGKPISEELRAKLAGGGRGAGGGQRPGGKGGAGGAN